MATLSMLAYHELPELKKELKARGYGKPYVFRDEKTDTTGFVTLRNSTAVVVFRGTAGLKNLFFVDAKFPRVKGFRGKVHKGFKQAFDALKGDVDRKLDDALRETQADSDGKQKIIFTGHSLGAVNGRLKLSHFRS